MYRPVLLPISKNSNEYQYLKCTNIDIDTKCGKILRQYQYLIKILKYENVIVIVLVLV